MGLRQLSELANLVACYCSVTDVQSVLSSSEVQCMHWASCAARKPKVDKSRQSSTALHPRILDVPALNHGAGTRQEPQVLVNHRKNKNEEATASRTESKIS